VDENGGIKAVDSQRSSGDKETLQNGVVDSEKSSGDKETSAEGNGRIGVNAFLELSGDKEAREERTENTDEEQGLSGDKEALELDSDADADVELDSLEQGGQELEAKDLDEPGKLDDTLSELFETARLQKQVLTDGTFSLIDQCIFFSEKKAGNLRLCIPTSLVADVLNLCHDARGHPGVRHTYTSIATRFYFRKMTRQVKRYVDNCTQCQTSKPSTQRPWGQLQSIETPSPYHSLGMDFVTGLPVSRGFDALLTITDLFTKAVKLVPCLKATSAEETASLYFKHCYTTFGLPTKIVSDRDTRFTSKFWSTLMQLLGVKMGMTTAFHPAADGQSERTNQTVEVALRCFLGGDTARYERWTDYLPIIEHEMNSTVNDSTGFSPNDLRYATKPRGLADLVLPLEGASESAERLVEELKNRRDEARDSIAIAQRKQKKYFDSKRQDKEFEVGDLVVLKFNRFGPGYKAPKPHDHKLAPVGTPLRIVEKISPLSYRVALPSHSRIHDVISIVHLRKYRGSGDHVRPLPVTVGNDEEYEVERIDGERINSQGGKEFLVKWLGYADNERTWESISNLDHAAEIIAQWHSQNKKSTGSSAPPARTSQHVTRSQTCPG
jgi:hypothetical protein